MERAVKNYNFLKMCVIGVIPMLMAVDCMSSAALYSLLYLSAATVTAFCLFCLRNVTNRAKYALAVMLSFAVNFWLSSNFFAGRYCTGVNSQIFIYVSSLSMTGIYFDYEFKHFDGLFDLIKYYLIVASSSAAIFFAYASMIYIFNDRLGNKVTFFSYPCSAIITAAVCALLISRVLKKTV
jgi:hypothetical protein